MTTFAIRGKLSDNSGFAGNVEATDAADAITSVKKGLPKGSTVTEIRASVSELGAITLSKPRKPKGTEAAK